MSGREVTLLICDQQARVSQVPLDGLGVAAGAVGRLVPTLFEGGSLSKALAFLAELRRAGWALGWELVTREDLRVVTAAGVADDAHLLVGLAHSTQSMAEGLEQVRHLDPPFDPLLHQLRARLLSERGRREEVYEELSRLNNELVAMHRELAKQHKRLEELNQEKNRFLGMAAHDLRGPLNAIMAYTDFLLEDCEALSPRHREFLETIRSSSAHMASLIEQLLDVAQIEAGELRLFRSPTEMRSLVARCLALNVPKAAAKGVNLRQELGPPVVAMVDPHKMLQVLNNLVANAIEASRPGGEVFVRMELDPGPTLEVVDQGPGIPPEVLPTLFSPFQRGGGEALHRGRGLGLWIAKRMVEGHGGTLQVHTGEGGTAFRICLPPAVLGVEGVDARHGAGGR